MNTPNGLKTPKRAIGLVPVVLALVVVVGAIALAFSHFSAKGPAPQLESTPSQIAVGQTPAERDAYNAQDYSEPNAK